MAERVLADYGPEASLAMVSSVAAETAIFQAAGDKTAAADSRYALGAPLRGGKHPPRSGFLLAWLGPKRPGSPFGLMWRERPNPSRAQKKSARAA